MYAIYKLWTTCNFSLNFFLGSYAGLDGFFFII